MIKKFSQSKGFTLLELMVVVAIISLMSVTTAIGFNRFSESVQVKETAGFLKDQLQALEIEVLQGDYLENNVYFLSNYLVIESSVSGSLLDLDFDLLACAGEPGLNIVTTQPVQLAKQNEFGETLDISTYTSDVVICPDFLNQTESILEYSLFSSNQWSDKVRFVSFNFQNLDSPDETTLIDENIRLLIDGPYVKKTVYRNDLEVSDSVELTLESSQGDTATVLLQD